MKYYESREQIVTEGAFIAYDHGYYNFEIDGGEVLAFDEIDRKVLEEYDLKSNQLNNKKFEIFYSIIIDDMDDEDFVILRLDNLKIKESLSHNY